MRGGISRRVGHLRQDNTGFPSSAALTRRLEATRACRISHAMERSRLSEFREGLKSCPTTKTKVERNDMQRIRLIEKRSSLPRLISTTPTKRKSWDEFGGGGRRIPNIGKKISSVSASRRSKPAGVPLRTTIAWWRSKTANAASASRNPTSRCSSTIVIRGGSCAPCFASTATACSVFPETTRIIWRRGPRSCASSLACTEAALRQPTVGRATREAGPQNCARSRPPITETGPRSRL
jgi:hypothetical protein